MAISGSTVLNRGDDQVPGDADSVASALSEVGNVRFDGRLRGYDRDQVDAFLTELAAFLNARERGEQTALSPAEIAGKTFDEALRGYDRDQVRSFLEAVSHVQAPQQPSEGRLPTSRMGDGTAPFEMSQTPPVAATARDLRAASADADLLGSAMAELQAARSEAARVRSEAAQAESKAARRVDHYMRTAKRIRIEVEADAARMRSEAEAAAAKATVEASQLRAAAAKAAEEATRELQLAKAAGAAAEREAARLIQLGAEQAEDLRARARQAAKEAKLQLAEAESLRAQAEELRSSAGREAALLRKAMKEDVRTGGAASLPEIRDVGALLANLLAELEETSAARSRHVAELVGRLQDQVGAAVGALHQELDGLGTHGPLTAHVVEKHLVELGERYPTARPPGQMRDPKRSDSLP